jgi:hypothetical protein
VTVQGGADVGDVYLHGARAEDKRAGELGVDLPLRHELEDLPLTAGQVAGFDGAPQLATEQWLICQRHRGQSEQSISYQSLVTMEISTYCFEGRGSIRIIQQHWRVGRFMTATNLVIDSGIIASVIPRTKRVRPTVGWPPRPTVAAIGLYHFAQNRLSCQSG